MEKEASLISNLRVEISIEDGANKALNSITAVLYRGKNAIINRDIGIQLNGEPLEFFVRRGNYYDKYPYFASKDLTRRAAYYFEIILSDSIKYPLAYIKPNKITTEFNFPEHIALDQDFVFDWKENNILADVEIWKGVHQKDNPNSHAGGRYAKSTIRCIMQNDSGNYTVRKSFYEDSLTVADYLKIRISHIENGLMNPELRANSKISYHYLLEKAIWTAD